MAWPAPDLPISYTNATVSLDTHPSAHNDTNQSLNNDYRPELIRVGGIADQNVLDIATTAGDLTAHATEAFITGGHANVAFTQGANPGFSVPAGEGIWQIRHGMFRSWWQTDWPTGPAGNTSGAILIESPEPGSEALLQDAMVTGHGSFRPSSGGTFGAVWTQWDATAGAHKLWNSATFPAQSGFDPMGNGGIFRFSWSYPTTRADTV